MTRKKQKSKFVQLSLFSTQPAAHALPEYYTCKRHGEWSREAYYTNEEIARMIKDQGFVDCPLCMAEIAGSAQ